MNQQLWNSKSLLEYARSLKGNGASPGEVSKLKDWQTAVLKRMREIQLLVPNVDPVFAKKKTRITKAELDARWPNRLPEDDPQIPALTAEFEKLQKKYQGVSDELIRKKQAAGALVK